MSLDVQDLQVHVQDRVLMNGFSYRFLPGKTYFIFGRNGVGKSCLLDSLAGLRPVRRGVIQYSKIASTGRAYLFQKDTLIPWLSVRENLRIIEGLDLSLAEGLIQEYGLWSLIGVRAASLSGGESQIVSFIRAISMAPNIIFADEPFSSVDYRYKEQLIGHFSKYCRERNATVIWVSHDLEEICANADEVLIFDGPQKRIVRSLSGKMINPNSLVATMCGSQIYD